MEKLWGENFFDPATKKWTKKQTDSKSCKRGFILFCYDPIMQVIQTAMRDDKTALFNQCEKLGIFKLLSSEDKELSGK